MKNTRALLHSWSACLASAIVLTASWTEAKGLESNSADFSGTWRHAGDPKEDEARQAAIDSATKDLSVFIRGRARKKLEKRTTPPSELRLEVASGRVEIAGEGAAVSLELGGAPITIEKDGKRGAVSAVLDGQRIVVTSKGEKGRRVTRYALSADRKQLTVFVRMTGERLSGPLVYQSTYQRKASKD